VVATQPYLPIVQGSSQTIVDFLYATSFLSRLLYDSPVASVALERVQVTHERSDPRHLLMYPSWFLTMYALPSRLGKNYLDGYNSSLILSSSVASFCSTSSGDVSRVPAAALARMSDSAAAISDCKRPSLDSRCANFAISPSYSSHSGIWRARASLGSFCETSRRDVQLYASRFKLSQYIPSTGFGTSLWF